MTATASETGRGYADRYYDVDGVRLHAVEWGSPDASDLMIMLHGVGSNAHYFNTLGPRIEDLLPGRYRIVALDHRGCGDSDKPETGYDLATAAADVIAVHDQLGGRPMTLVGHSRGAWLAPYIAGTWPERVRELILIDPARLVYETPQDVESFYSVIEAGLGPFPSWAAAVQAYKDKDPGAKWTAEREAALRAGLQPGPNGTWLGKMPRRVLAALREARTQTDQVSPVLPKVTAPVLMFVSSRSNDRRKAQKLRYAQLLPEVVRLEMVDASHAIHQDEPDLVAGIIRDFLGTPQRRQNGDDT